MQNTKWSGQKRQDFRDKHQNSDVFWERQQCFPLLSSYKQRNHSRHAVTLTWAWFSEGWNIWIFLWPFKVFYFSGLFCTIVSNDTSDPCVFVWIRDAQIPMWVRAQAMVRLNSCAIIKCLFSYEMVLWLYWINSNRITSLSSVVLVSGWLVCSIGHNWTVEVEAAGLNRR